MKMLYSNEFYYLLRKPHGIASTFGQQASILDYFQHPHRLQTYLQENSDFDTYRSYCYLDGYTQQLDYVAFVEGQKTQFTQSQEFWLLNRLDNDTWGFLYFAKDPEVYTMYKEHQQIWLINKMYLAEVSGNPFFKTNDKEITIETPIMHHQFDRQRMIVVQEKQDQNKGRGELHKVSTKIKLISYDKSKNTSLLLVTIHKGMRHQIRVHCKSKGCPILWDILYGPKPPVYDFLHLRSIGMN
jgi:23S rRNA-/tRNA-specific pseudouridylate synthase